MNKKAKIISFINNKGGVGKTTTCINLATCLGMKEKKILIVDFDPQGHLTTGLKIQKRHLRKTIYDVLIKKENFENIIKKNILKNVDLLPANMNLATINLNRRKFRINNLKKAIENLKKNYDYIFIDCPPSFGLLIQNALNASNSIIIPVQAEFYALEGLTELLSVIRLAQKNYNNNLNIEGILITMYDRKAKISKEIKENILKYFSKKVYKSIIYRDTKIPESQLEGMPIIHYDENSQASKAYFKFANEFLKNNSIN